MMRWLRSARDLSTFILSVLTGFALTVDAYVGGTHAARFALVLIGLNAIHALLYPRFRVFRELTLYGMFIAYMLVTLLWTDDFLLGLGTVLRAANFALIVLLLSGLFSYHDLTAVLQGLVVGFLLGAGWYAVMERFPLVFPEGFSYNTMAGMYLFGLFITVVCGWYRGSRVVPIVLSVVLVVHIAATTSIKTNLGMALGVSVAVLIYFTDSIKLLARNFALLILFGAGIAYFIASNEALYHRIEGGLTRVSLGAQILAAREDTSGSVGFDTRRYWETEGLKGWTRNPVLGYGVEAFRADYGNTSHSTVIDLLYNAGLVGFGLFFGIFVSIAWRLYRASVPAVRGFRAVAIAGLVCYLFMSLSATLYYDTFVAAFVAIGAGVLARFASRPPQITAARVGASAP